MEDPIDELEAESENLQDQIDSSQHIIEPEEDDEGEDLRQRAPYAGVRKPMKSRVDGSDKEPSNAGQQENIAFGVARRCA